jgi:hypothetical protein
MSTAYRILDTLYAFVFKTLNLGHVSARKKGKVGSHIDSRLSEFRCRSKHDERLSLSRISRSMQPPLLFLILTLTSLVPCGDVDSSTGSYH